MHTLDDTHIDAGRFEGAATPRDAEEVSVRCNGVSPPCKLERCIYFPLRSDAHRAPGAHHDLQPLRQHAAKACPRNCCFMCATDVHEREIPIDKFFQFLGYFPSHESHFR